MLYAYKGHQELTEATDDEHRPELRAWQSDREVQRCAGPLERRPSDASTLEK